MGDGFNKRSWVWRGSCRRVITWVTEIEFKWGSCLGQAATHRTFASLVMRVQINQQTKKGDQGASFSSCSRPNNNQ